MELQGIGGGGGVPQPQAHGNGYPSPRPPMGAPPLPAGAPPPPGYPPGSGYDDDDQVCAYTVYTWMDRYYGTCVTIGDL